MSMHGVLPLLLLSQRTVEMAMVYLQPSVGCPEWWTARLPCDLSPGHTSAVPSCQAKCKACMHKALTVPGNKQYDYGQLLEQVSCLKASRRCM